MRDTRVIIASVFRPGTFQLYRAQSHFVQLTTPGLVRHMVVSPERPPFVCDWVQAPAMAGKHRGQQQHLAGLHAAVRQFGQDRSWDLAVLADSDAFPVRAGWANDLWQLMRQNGRLFAAPIRVEFCHLFPHVCFLACTSDVTPRRLIDELGYSQGATIFADRQHHDVVAGVSMRDTFPLLKSNRWSPSPLLHTIYGDIVYHRGGGSYQRPLAQTKYWRAVAPALHDEACSAQAPTPAWINRLLGEQRFREVEV
jgi:hypothetical protein